MNDIPQYLSILPTVPPSKLDLWTESCCLCRRKVRARYSRIMRTKKNVHYEVTICKNHALAHSVDRKYRVFNSAGLTKSEYHATHNFPVIPFEFDLV